MRDVVARCRREVSLGPEGPHATYVFPGDLEVFAGHFPGRPLLPAVFLIEAARGAAEQALGQPVELVRLARAKFTAEVPPDAPVEVALMLAAEDDGWSLRATATCQGATAATLRGRLRPGPL